ncbi:hypothetical protein ACLOJK_024441 [Asimina triloba]
MEIARGGGLFPPDVMCAVIDKMCLLVMEATASGNVNGFIETEEDANSCKEEINFPICNESNNEKLLEAMAFFHQTEIEKNNGSNCSCDLVTGQWDLLQRRPASGWNSEAMSLDKSNGDRTVSGGQREKAVVIA